MLSLCLSLYTHIIKALRKIFVCELNATIFNNAKTKQTFGINDSMFTCSCNSSVIYLFFEFVHIFVCTCLIMRVPTFVRVLTYLPLRGRRQDNTPSNRDTFRGKNYGTCTSEFFLFCVRVSLVK